MLKQRHLRLLVTALTALVMVTAACGSDSDPASTTGQVPQIDDSDDGLPLADDDVVPLEDEGPCAPDEPDCEETLGEHPEARIYPTLLTMMVARLRRVRG